MTIMGMSWQHSLGGKTAEEMLPHIKILLKLSALDFCFDFVCVTAVFSLVTTVVNVFDGHSLRSN